MGNFWSDKDLQVLDRFGNIEYGIDAKGLYALSEDLISENQIDLKQRVILFGLYSLYGYKAFNFVYGTPRNDLVNMVELDSRVVIGWPRRESFILYWKKRGVTENQAVYDPDGLIRTICSEIISERGAEYTLSQIKLLKKIITEVIYNFAIIRGKKGLVMP